MLHRRVSIVAQHGQTECWLQKGRLGHVFFLVLFCFFGVFLTAEGYSVVRILQSHH